MRYIDANAFNPLVENVTKLTDSQIDEKIRDLNKKMMIVNSDLMRESIQVVLNSYLSEATRRRQRMLQKLAEENKKDLDGLIKTS